MRPKLILTMLLMLAAFCVKSQTKDSTYKITHDSTFIKHVKDTVKIPYDSSFYALVKIDSIAKHDSVYKENYNIYSDHYEARIFLTTHDSIVDAITPVTQRIRHDSTWWKCPRFRKCRWVTTTARHDTTKYNLVPVSIQTTHDTTLFEKVFDTIPSVKDSIGLTIHDTSFYRNTYFPYTAYKDSIIFWDSSYIAKITHDTTVHLFKPIWGLKIQQDKFVNQLSVAKSLGITAIRPNSIGIKDFNGDLGNCVDWHLNGILPVMNVNWIDNPSLKPYNFVSGSDTVIFKTNFDKICAAIKVQIGTDIVMVMENEPTNEQYYNWDSSKYVHELQMAITIAHKYGLKVTDGCIHLELVEMVRTNTMGNNKNAPKVKSLLAAFKNLNLDYVDTHCSYEITQQSPTGYPVPSIKTTVDYIRQQTGKNVICNEYHMVGANATVVNWFISQWKNAQVPIVVPWSGDNVKSDAYNLGTTITQNIGVPYQQGIK